MQAANINMGAHSAADEKHVCGRTSAGFAASRHASKISIRCPAANRCGHLDAFVSEPKQVTVLGQPLLFMLFHGPRCNTIVT